MIAAREAIKDEHSQMVVFVYFQYENVKAHDLWDLIRPFATNSDVVAFSSYPSLPINGPNSGLTAEALTADYYALIRENLAPECPIAFAELGHPASASSLFALGSEQEQALFIQKFFSAIPHNTAFVVWTHLYDPDLYSVYPPEVAEFFGSTGLLRIDPWAPTGRGWTTWP